MLSSDSMIAISIYVFFLATFFCQTHFGKLTKREYVFWQIIGCWSSYLWNIMKSIDKCKYIIMMTTWNTKDSTDHSSRNTNIIPNTWNHNELIHVFPYEKCNFQSKCTQSIFTQTYAKNISNLSNILLPQPQNLLDE